MEQTVRTTFKTLVDFLPSELEKMPLGRWAESVVRYFYCRFLAASFPDVEQFVECNRIDLVLRRGAASAFVEFKLYGHPVRFDPYDGSVRGFKGGPGRKNLAEFQSCVEQLYGRPPRPGLCKYILLVYADPADGARPNLRFSNQYDEYRHPHGTIPLIPLENCAPIEAANAIVRAQLFEVRHALLAGAKAAQCDHRAECQPLSGPPTTEERC